MGYRSISGVLLLAACLGIAVMPNAQGAPGARTILLLEPRTTNEDLKGRAFLREFAREGLATAGYDLRVQPVDQLDVEKLALQVDAALATSPALIVAPASRIALYVAARNVTIPTLFVSVEHPSVIGLVANAAQPERNLTGLTFSAQDNAKMFEVARELAGDRATVGLLVDRFWATLDKSQAMVESTRTTLGLDTRVFAADSAAEAIAAIRAYRGPRVDCWVVLDTPLGRYHGRELLKELRAYGGAILSARRDVFEAGAHMLVQPLVENPMKTLAEMGDLILRGIPMSRVPVARPKRFAIEMNMPAVEMTPGPRWRALITSTDHFRRAGTDAAP